MNLVSEAGLDDRKFSIGALRFPEARKEACLVFKKELLKCKRKTKKTNQTTLNPKTTDSHAWISTEAVETRFGDFEFKNGYPTPAAADALLEQLRLNRAIEVYLTQIPPVSVFVLRHPG
jgi:hypothetical protein